ncbi:SEC-C metal-binding domain-containing protein [Dehalococcoidia bacterium]|nr:SEC-C metal-binding domain-containing protein [Dehalococcoidia bacterium]
MAFIWTPEALENLLLHRSADVQRWAIRRSLDLYPDILGDQVIRLIASASAETSSLILHRLAQLDLFITNPDPLVELARGDNDLDLKALAGAILLRSDHALLPSEIESVSATLYPRIVGSTERGFDLLLRVYGESDADNKSILDGIAHACNFADLPRDLARAEGEEGIKERIKYFGKVWGCDIPRLERLSQPEEVQSALEQALAWAIPEDSTPWKQGLLAELEQDRARLAALRDIAKERLSRWSTEERRLLLACILCLRRNEACRSRLIEAQDVPRLWRALVMKPWRGVLGQALRDFLLRAKPEELHASLSKALSEEYSYAAYALSILNTLDTPGRFELFLDVFEGKKYGDVLAEEAGEPLRKAGVPASQYIIEHYPQMSGDLRTLILHILDSLPTPQVVDFCLEHFEDYTCSRDPSEFVGCLGEIGSDRFLAPLLREWKEGEVGIGRAIKLISEIHSVRDEQIDRVIRDAERRARHPEDALERPISLFPLRCTECGHTYHYELRNIYMDKGGQPIIGDIIQCKGCRSIETYEMTIHTRFGIIAEMMRLVALKEAQERETFDSLDTPLKVYDKFRLRALGRKVKSAGEAYHLLKGEIEKHPQDAVLQRHMGNVIRNGGRPDLALPYYLEAIRLNPHDAESYHCIVDTFIERGQYREAIPYLERLIPLCRESKLDEDLRRGLFSALLNQVNIIQEETGHKVELFPLAKPDDLREAKGPITLNIRSFDPSDPEGFEWLYHAFRYGRAPKEAIKSDFTLEASRPPEVLRQSPVLRPVRKIGRNDPCPCGSGKKYKKCCGR